VERDILGSGATAAGMGHIVVMDDSEAQFALTRRSQLLWQALSANLPTSAEFESPGTIWAAADEEELAEAARKRAWLAQRDVPAVCSPAVSWQRWNQTCAKAWPVACS